MLDQPNSAEDTDSVKRDLDQIPDALAWPTAWPTNVFARSEAQTLMDDLLQNYPGRGRRSSPQLLKRTAGQCPCQPIHPLAIRSPQCIPHNDRCF
jgi:hypothetical protein